MAGCRARNRPAKSLLTGETRPDSDSDGAALRAAAVGAALCTIVDIQGSFSRRVGAQLAVGGDGRIAGDLADGCLEAALAADIAALTPGTRQLVRYGAGSARIDQQLPCGGGLDILIDTAPDRAVLAEAVARLDRRQPATLALPIAADGGAVRLLADDQPTGRTPGLFRRRYAPPLRLIALGAGPELAALCRLAAAAGIALDAHRPIGPPDQGDLALGRAPQGIAIDRWSAILMLFHDHEWERALLPWALASDAFFIGAQGGHAARAARIERLRAEGTDEAAIARVRSPVGLIARARDPAVLALSALADIVAAYEHLVHDRGR